MTTRTESLQEWERAEIARSSVEATLTADEGLRVSPQTFTRYARPPRDTAYPLEYAYHELGEVAGKRIVDFGCGSGANSVLLANRGAHVWGIDISEDLLLEHVAAGGAIVEEPRQRAVQAMAAPVHVLAIHGVIDVHRGVGPRHAVPG